MSRSQATILTNMCLIEDGRGNIVMQIRYFNNGMKTSKPISANVLEIKQKTPIGANFITTIVISIIISLN